MEVRVAVLADAANEAPPKKLNVLGMFDSIKTREFPAILPSMVLVLRYRLDYEDGGKAHTLKVTFRDEDGKEIGSARADATIGEIKPGKFGHENVILNFAGIRFAREGHYVFEVTWDGALKARVDLLVERAGVQPGGD
jgi:hypothetical protein